MLQVGDVVKRKEGGLFASDDEGIVLEIQDGIGAKVEWKGMEGMSELVLLEELEFVEEQM